MNTDFAPTAQQQDFLTALTTTQDHLALVARAGCGKSSTILLGVAAIAKVQPRAEQLVCAYNKAIADEMGGKLKKAGYDWKQVQASTMHSLGWGLIRFAFRLGNEAIDDKKVSKIIETINDDIATEYPNQIAALVRYAKQMGFGFFPDLAVENAQAWYDMADHYDINGLEETSEMEAIVACAQNVYRRSLADTKTIDFDDMILFPLVKNLRTKFTKDYIYLDEAQDLSRARQALARKFLRYPGGRMIVVGDDRQAIYGFSGADAAALDNLITSLNATVLPLSVTWRCPKAVVALAQTKVPDIEAAPSAPEGKVTSISKDDFLKLATDGQLTKDDAILCRNTAPLIETAYKLIRAGVPCKVEGRQIGEGLIALCRRWKIKTTDALQNRLNDYQEREVQKAMAKGQEQKAEAVADKCETLRQIILAVNGKGLNNVSDVIEFINNLFADDVKGVLTLATYHRSKGREWGNVFLWEHAARCPSRAAKQAWQLAQEENLAYVAFTRAMRTLTRID